MWVTDWYPLALSVSFPPASSSHVDFVSRVYYSPGSSWNLPGHCENPVDPQEPEVQVQLVLEAEEWVAGFCQQLDQVTGTQGCL